MIQIRVNWDKEGCFLSLDPEEDEYTIVDAGK
jgi:hypothetical protein